MISFWKYFFPLYLHTKEKMCKQFKFGKIHIQELTTKNSNIFYKHAKNKDTVILSIQMWW